MYRNVWGVWRHVYVSVAGHTMDVCMCVHVCILGLAFPSCRFSSLGCCIGMQASDNHRWSKCHILVPGPQLSLPSGHSSPSPQSSSCVHAPVLPPALFADPLTAFSQSGGPLGLLEK